MHRYLQDTEFACKNLFRLATDEENNLKFLVAQLPPLEQLRRSGTSTIFGQKSTKD